MAINIPPNVIVEDEEVLQGAFRVLDFTGAGVTITPDGSRATVTIPGAEGVPGGGDMTKNVYDTNNNGVVDNSEKLDGHTYLEVVGCHNLDGGDSAGVYGGTTPVDGGDST
jgi:hypothetical protein